MAHKKAQLSAGFYTAMIVFIGFVGYITFQLFQTVPTTINAVRSENMRIEAYQISELLVNDVGEPNDWETKQLSQIERIGLSDATQNKTNYLSTGKINQLQTICNNNYNDLKRLLDIDNEISIEFIDHATDTGWVCNPNTQQNSFRFNRIVSVDGTSSAELIIEMWRQ
ncbi:MAG: hypothetical protein HYW24_02670 [Candidatus Aenigmarchaeota archaeon]|nr:hypothetical protein [Candidatus Aenigmarchaeota archaeon]